MSGKGIVDVVTFSLYLWHMGRARNGATATTTTRFDAVMGRTRGRWNTAALFGSDKQQHDRAFEMLLAEIENGEITEALQLFLERDLNVRYSEDADRLMSVLAEHLWTSATAACEECAAHADRKIPLDLFAGSSLLEQSLDDGSERQEFMISVLSQLAKPRGKNFTELPLGEQAHHAATGEVLAQLDEQIVEAMALQPLATIDQLLRDPQQIIAILKWSGVSKDKLLGHLNERFWQRLYDRDCPAVRPDGSPQTIDFMQDKIDIFFNPDNHDGLEELIVKELDSHLTEEQRDRVRKKDLHARHPGVQVTDLLSKIAASRGRAVGASAHALGEKLPASKMRNLAKAPASQNLPYNSQRIASLEITKEVCRPLGAHWAVMYLSGASMELLSCPRRKDGRLASDRYNAMLTCIHDLRSSPVPQDVLDAIQEQIDGTSIPQAGDGSWCEPYAKLIQWEKERFGIVS